MRKHLMIAIWGVMAFVGQMAMAQVTNTTTLNESLWRNEQTGDWEIGFFSDCAVYDCDFWDYQSIKAKGDKFEIALKNGHQQVTVSVGKAAKDGKRQMTIGGKKQTYAQITTEELPDYPTKDTRTTFKDNDFRRGDSITFVGWLRNLPDDWKAHLKELDCGYNTLMSDYSHGDKRYAIPFDSLQRFRLKIPVENTCVLFFRLIPFVVEPGETYFFYLDFNKKQGMFMGNDVRMQNEWATHNFSAQLSNYEDQKFAPDSLGHFLRKMAEKRAAKEAELDSMMKANPTLSERLRRYYKGLIWREYANTIGQARFSMPTYVYPDSVLTMMKTELWDKIQRPYSLFVNTTFLNDFLDMCDNRMLKQRLTGGVNSWDFTKQLIREGRVTLDNADYQDFEKYFAELEQNDEVIRKAKSQQEIIDIINDFNKRHEAIISRINDSFEKKGINALLREQQVQQAFDEHLQMHDSLGTDPTLRDICMARWLLSDMDRSRAPMHEALVPRVEKDIHNDMARSLILQKRDQFVALEKGDLAHAASLRPSSDVANMTDGEKILRKLIEPYKGRLVYIDIWGTWCGPCKEGLSHTAELKEALKEHDIVYLYLANRSPEDSWKNVIKQYNLTGENSVHYNLPANQQAAVEQYLGVHSFPTYKLVDREGNIHDLDWRHTNGDLEAFEKEIRKYDK